MAVSGKASVSALCPMYPTPCLVRVESQDQQHEQLKSMCFNLRTFFRMAANANDSHEAENASLRATINRFEEENAVLRATINRFEEENAVLRESIPSLPYPQPTSALNNDVYIEVLANFMCYIPSQQRHDVIKEMVLAFEAFWNRVEEKIASRLSVLSMFCLVLFVEIC